MKFMKLDQNKSVHAIGAMNKKLEAVLTQLAELYCRQGWKALNYSSWDTFLTTEFGMTTAELEVLWQRMPEQWKKENLAVFSDYKEVRGV